MDLNSRERLNRMRRLVLVGTSHKYQLPENHAANEFRAFIEQVCITRQARCITEEMSQEALAQKRVSQSVCGQIANAPWASFIDIWTRTMSKGSLLVSGKSRRFSLKAFIMTGAERGSSRNSESRIRVGSNIG